MSNDDNVVPFNGTTMLDIDPDKILSRAIGKMKRVVIVGVDKDDMEYFASSMGKSAEILWSLERCKKHLLRDDEQ